MRCLLVSLAVVLAALTALLLAHSANAEPSEATEKYPHRILHAAIDQIVAAKNITADVGFSVRVVTPVFEHERLGRYKVAIMRPNKFAFKLHQGDKGSTLVCDGEQLITFSEELRQYTQVAAPSSLEEFSQSMEGMMMLSYGMGGYMMGLLEDEPPSWLKSGFTSRKYIGIEDLDGVDCHHLRFDHEELDFDAWITAGDEPKVRRIRPDLSEHLDDDESEMEFSVIITVDYDNWEFDPKIDDEYFAFTPPATAKLVEAITPRMPVPVTPPIVEAHPLLGEPAPKFALVKLEDDEAFELADVLGKQVVVLDFWATWCGPCVEALPKLSEVAQDFADRDVTFYAVNLEEDAETIRKFLEQADPKINLPVLLDSTAAVGKKYKVQGIPQTVLIGLDGRVQVIHTGLKEDMKRELTEQLAALLAGKDLAAEEIDEAGETPADEG
ncbi:MAG: DUF2092 domain-containing protein [Aeoliella sp.]